MITTWRKLVPSFGTAKTPGDLAPWRFTEIAESYVRLVLAIGQHDPDYVDAYHGPESWKSQAEKEKKSLSKIQEEAEAQIKKLVRIKIPATSELETLRHEFLLKQLQSLIARVKILQRHKMSFDEESLSLYNAVAPTYPKTHFQKILDEIEALLPGKETLSRRYEDFRQNFLLPKEKLDEVFQAAMKECRRRTKAHIPLPENENFTIEYVTDKPWTAYNWYKGNYQSLIQINTSLPIYVDSALETVCHEGYPGHHVYNVLLETEFLKKRNWIEFSIYPLFSPQSLIAEGTANYGVDVAFPESERITFEAEVLFPIAAIDPALAEPYYKIRKRIEQLQYAANEAARRYLDGEIRRDEAVHWLEQYALMDSDRARNRVKFFEKYRSYVINYNLGEDLVRKYVESKGGTPDQPERQWQEFYKLISSPRLPSGLK